MPYIMVMGSLSAPHLSSDGATVYGLKSEERATLVRVKYQNSLFNITKYLPLDSQGRL